MTPNPEKTPAEALSVPHVSATATRESKWRIRIADCYVEYEYELTAGVDDVSIHELYELVRNRLKADDVIGRFVDPDEPSSSNPADEPRAAKTNDSK